MSWCPFTALKNLFKSLVFWCVDKIVSKSFSDHSLGTLYFTKGPAGPTNLIPQWFPYHSALLSWTALFFTQSSDVEVFQLGYEPHMFFLVHPWRARPGLICSFTEHVSCRVIDYCVMSSLFSFTTFQCWICHITQKSKKSFQ